MISGSPISSAAIADVGTFEQTIPNESVSTGVPTVGTTAISQDHVVTLVYTANPASVPNLTCFEDESFSAPNVIAGHVRVGDGVFTQEHTLAGADVSAQVPTVATSAITQVHSIAANDVSAGSVSVSTATAIIQHVLAGNDVFTQNPTIATSAITQVHNIAANDVNTSNPTAATTAIAQNHQIVTDDVLSGNFDVGLLRRTWTPESLASETWTEQLKSAETWTEAA
jgi:hypothetical protein